MKEGIGLFNVYSDKDLMKREEENIKYISLTSGISFLLRAVNIILFTFLLIHLIHTSTRSTASLMSGSH